MEFVPLARQREADARHRFIADDGAQQELLARALLLFRNCQGGRYGRRAGMAVAAFEAVVELIAMRAQAIGECRVLRAGFPRFAIDRAVADARKLFCILVCNAAPWGLRGIERHAEMVEHQMFGMPDNRLRQIGKPRVRDELRKQACFVHE